MVSKKNPEVTSGVTNYKFLTQKLQLKILILNNDVDNFGIEVQYYVTRGLAPWPLRGPTPPRRFAR